MIRSQARLRSVVATAALAGFLFLAMNQLWASEQSETAAQKAAPVLDSAVRSQQDSLFARIDQDYRLVEPILMKSCFDCHSNATHFPWYHKIPLVKGMIDKDIKVARSHVDFTGGFPFKSRHEVLDYLDAIKTEISQADMPPWSYRIMHWGSLIEGSQKDSVLSWVASASSQIESFYDTHGITYKKPDTTSAEGDDTED